MSASETPPPSEETSGPLLAGRYQCEEVIGRGGVGTVYRAHDRGEDRWVAIKVLEDIHHGTKVEQRLLREGEVMQKLDHPNIVQVYDVVRDAEEVFMVMELMDRGSCHSLTRRKKGLPVAWVFHVATSVLSGLERIHEAGWVHRDLKPGNLLLNRQGVVKISDFGILRDEGSDLTLPGISLGTGAYMSPEQQVDAHDLDHRSDVFSLGATLYAMNTNRVPLNVALGKLQEAEERYGKELPPDKDPLARVHEALRPVVRRACQWQPQDRYQTAQEMQVAVQEHQRRWKQARQVAT